MCVQFELKLVQQGKQRVYVVNQDTLPVVEKSKLDEMDAQIASLEAELQADTGELEAIDKQLKALNSEPTTENAESVVRKLTEQNAVLRKRLNAIKQSDVRVSQSDRERIEKKFDHGLSEWRKRKKLVDVMVNQVLEGGLVMPSTRFGAYC